MWKCIRCEKENQDNEESCAACGHGKTMDYTGHRTLSKIFSPVTDNWKSSQSDPEYFKDQALKHLKEAAELLEKSGFSGAAAKINEVITEVEQYSPRQKLQMDFTMILRMYLEKTQALQTEKKTEFQNRKQQQRTIYIEQDTDIVKNKTPNIRIVENHHSTQQDTNSFRVGGQNVLGKDTNPAVQEKTDTQEPSAVIYARDILLNDGKAYDGSSIAEICRKFLSYEENKGIDTGRKDNIINTLKIPSGDAIYLVHDDSWFKRGKNGFAVTDRGIYVKDIGDAADFVPWEEFRKCKNIESKSCYVTADGRKLAYITGGDRLRSQVERLFITIYKLLNEKEN